MTDCPPRLRGDLSKWLCEINTGVYVGHVSSRVREALWERVCMNLKTGSASMVFTTNTEQRMDFRVCNTNWTPVDFDGIKLMRRPLPGGATGGITLKPGFSNAAKRQMAQRQRGGSGSKGRYVVIDLETTGLHPERDEIIELGAVRVVGGVPEAEFSCLLRYEGTLPGTITELTGLTDEQLRENGLAPRDALKGFLDFIKTDKLVGYNIAFDMEFLRYACGKYDMVIPASRCVDMLGLARRKVTGLKNYKLDTLAAHFSLADSAAHRALADCKLTAALYQKLNEI